MVATIEGWNSGDLEDRWVDNDDVRHRGERRDSSDEFAGERGLVFA
jgi:hypothetical protein